MDHQWITIAPRDGLFIERRRTHLDASVTISFAVLGPLTVSDDSHTVELAPSRPATLLAALLLNANSVLSPEALCRVVWDNRPPRNARATVQTCMRRLRRLLGQFGLPENRIETTAGGYRFPADEHELDLARFRKLVHDADATPEPDDKVTLFRESLGLWRGRPLPNVRSDALVRDDVSQLVEEWLWVAEQTYGVELALGRHAEILPELRSVTAAHPDHEPLWRQLIEALYSTGRQADALAAFDRIRDRLRDSLGVDPSPMLTQLQLTILRGETVAQVPVRPAADSAPGRTPALTVVPDPHELLIPRPVAGFVGRTDELAALGQRLGEHGGLAGLSGLPGIGKTALAVQAAHRLADRFPDGVYQVDATELGAVDRGAIHDRLTELRRRRAVLVVDGVHDSETVAALLDTPSAGVTLVTGIPTLLPLAVGHGGLLQQVGPLGDAESADLLRRHVGERRWADDPDTARELARRCAGHPGMLQLVATRLLARPRMPAREFLHWLTDEPSRALACGAGTRLPGTDLQGYLEHIDPAVALAFLTLAAETGTDGELDLARCTDVLGIAPERAATLLDDLVIANLVDEAHPGAFTVHPVLRFLARGADRRPTTTTAPRLDVIR